jgi:hypothetical protein
LGERSLARDSKRHKFWYPFLVWTSTGKTEPSSIVNSLPTIGRIPHSRAAV